MPPLTRSTKLGLAGAGIGLAVLAGCSQGPDAADGDPDEGPGEAAESPLGPCSPGDAPEGALCATVEVPEDRGNPDGRRVGLQVVVLAAEEANPEPDPIFFLAGGPGQAATDLAPLLGAALPELRRRRDFVFVDQRGTGGSNRLHCDFLDEPLSPSDSVPEDVTEADWRGCLEELDASPEHYATPDAMDDLEEVRVALGYGPINLWGGSYGTRAAAVFLRRHPESVRSAILDGVAPVDMGIPVSFPEDAQRALTLMIEACEADADCRTRFPDLGESVAELLRRMDEDPPRRVSVRHPRTGDWEEIPLPRSGVAAVLRAVLYSPQLASLAPLMIESALDGDFGPLVTVADPVTGPGLAIGMFLSVLCAEDIPFVNAGDAARAAEETVFDAVMFEQMVEACSVWPRAELPPGYREPVASEAPVLILSGELDPVTPPRWGEHAAATLPNARHFVVPGAAHGTLSFGCVPELIGAFIDAGDASGLDAECLDAIRRPPFWLTGTGPDAESGS